MTRLRLSFGVSLLVAGVVAPPVVRAQVPDPQAQLQGTSPDPTAQIPENLQIGNLQFDGSVAGFRAYLETTKSSDPNLYGQLAPDVARLEWQQSTAEKALTIGVIAGLASLAYGIFGRNDCQQPQVTDPNFAADTAAWSSCNQGNVTKLAVFGLVGVGAMGVGGAVAYSYWPKRQDLFDLVNKHNQLSKQPLRLQIGYDPTQRFAFSGATVSF
jgi:hypothetical protein